MHVGSSPRATSGFSCRVSLGIMYIALGQEALAVLGKVGATHILLCPNYMREDLETFFNVQSEKRSKIKPKFGTDSSRTE